MVIYLLRESIRRNSVLTFSRSGGPGGQNVNKVNTKVMLRLSLSKISGLTEAETTHAREKLINRINAEDEIVISSDEERSQNSNTEKAYCRIEALIVSAARLPKRRRLTKPSKAAREKRLQTKRLHSLKKALRNTAWEL